jgi:hypothetical protein
MAEAKGMKTNQVAGTPLERGRGRTMMGIRTWNDGGWGHTKRSKDEPYDLER